MFTSTPGARGGCLQEFIDISQQDAFNLLGPCDPDGFWDEENGYDGQEWTFTEDSSGEPVCLYSRWGSFRIGSMSPAAALNFKNWLLEELKAHPSA
jgi:hypothetical protein